MSRHPSHSFSLDSETLFSSGEDEENYDLNSESLWKSWNFISCVNALSKYIPISRPNLEKLSRNLFPVELHLQVLYEILYNQKLHVSNPLRYQKSTATKYCYIKPLGLDMAIELDQLIDDSKTNMEFSKTPEHWYSILPSSYLMAEYGLDNNFKNLVSRSFRLLHSHWQKSGLLTEKGEAIEGIRPQHHMIAKKTLGEDIGMRTVPYLLFGQKATFFRRFKFLHSNPFIEHKEYDHLSYVPNNIPSINFLHKVKKTLNKYGVAVVRNVFSNDQIKEIKNTLYIKSSLARDNVFKIIEVDPNVSPFKFSGGRINLVLRGTSFNEALSPLQSFWMPFVYYFMKSDQKIFLSNVQLISADPMSFVEPWHRENKHSGISIVVPLQDTDKSNGRMQFLPGTQSDLVKVNSFKTGPVGVDLKVGDILLYNNSILHRNTINQTDVCQSMIVFTYDHVDTPPPGQGLVKYIVDNFYGNVIVNLNKLIFD